MPANYHLPIVLVQHMPETFTAEFAYRLDKQAKLHVKQAEEGDTLEPGNVYLAPGGKQMMFKAGGEKASLHIADGDDRVAYKPSVDICFASAANLFEDKVLGIVLTGMGRDGCDGARILKDKNATIWTQDEDSSLIYGMPAAVYEANLSDQVLTLEQIAQSIVEVT